MPRPYLVRLHFMLRVQTDYDGSGQGVHVCVTPGTVFEDHLV
jgi:hypothetical protein